MVLEVDDDDVFFADLNRQISLLITEDEDDYCPSTISSDHYPSSVSIQQTLFSRTTKVYPSAQAQQPRYQSFDHHHSHTTTYKTTTTTTATFDHQSKGTGVFIPKSSSQFTKRRSNKHQPKITSTNTKQHVNYYYYNTNYKSSYKQQLTNQGVLAQVLVPKNF